MPIPLILVESKIDISRKLIASLTLHGPAKCNLALQKNILSNTDMVENIPVKYKSWIIFDPNFMGIIWVLKLTFCLCEYDTAAKKSHRLVAS